MDIDLMVILLRLEDEKAAEYEDYINDIRCLKNSGGYVMVEVLEEYFNLKYAAEIQLMIELQKRGTDLDEIEQIIKHKRLIDKINNQTLYER